MEPTDHSIHQVEKNQIFEYIKNCIADNGGFYMTLNGKTVLVKSIKEVPNKYSCDKVKSVASDIVSPTVLDASIHVGSNVYYGGYVEDEGTFMFHKGHISSIGSENDTKTFTIDGPRVSHYTGNPVFTYDKIKKILDLAGVITSQKQKENATEAIDRAVHVSMFLHTTNFVTGEESSDDEIRKPKELVQVSSGNYIGIESRAKGSLGRRIKINGPGVANQIYKLKFMKDGKKVDVHDCKDYIKDAESLYQSALESFLAAFNQNGQIPGNFNFVCYKEDFVANSI